MNTFKPGIVTIQATKARTLGCLNIENKIFDTIRKGGNGVGFLTAADKNLSPMLISTGKEEGWNSQNGPQEDESSKEHIYRF